jgi:hypothetical protein
LPTNVVASLDDAYGVAQDKLLLRSSAAIQDRGHRKASGLDRRVAAPR